MIDDFFTKLSVGVGIEVTSPIYLLRQKLILCKGSVAKSNNNGVRGLTFAERQWSVVKAWNFYRGGKKMKSFGHYQSSPINILP